MDEWDNDFHVQHDKKGTDITSTFEVWKPGNNIIPFTNNSLHLGLLSLRIVCS